jgi:Flp pilus assembly protein TadD
MQSNQDGAAEPLLEAVLRTQPELTEARVNLGIVLFRSGRYAQAEEELSKAVREQPKSAVAYNYLGILHRVKGQFPEAKAAYEQAINVDPNYGNAILNLGILYDLYLHDLPKALDNYQKYQRLQPAEDKDVAKWIADVKRRIDGGKQ